MSEGLEIVVAVEDEGFENRSYLFCKGCSRLGADGCQACIDPDVCLIL